MGKRLAESQLSREDLENSSDEENGNGSEDNGFDNPDQIAQRKIVKVKRSIQSNQDVGSNHGKLQLSGQINPSDTKTEYQDDKSEDKKTEQKEKPASMFGNLGSINATGGAQTSMFGGQASNSGQSLFGSGFKFTTTTSTTGGASIFNGGSLFGSSSTGGSLFGSGAASGSLFGSSSTTGGSLFSSTTPLFAGNNALFKAPESNKNGDGEGDEEDDDDNFGKGDGSPPAFGGDQSGGFGELSRPMKLNIESRPPEKSPYVKKFSNQVEKFKLVTPVVVGGQKKEEKKSMGRGNISIEVAEINNKQVYICVFRNLIGKNLYQGTISSKFSKKRRIEEKAMKLQLKLALVTLDPATKKSKVDHSVISFTRSDDLKQFEKEFEDAINTIKSQETDSAKSEESKKE